MKKCAKCKQFKPLDAFNKHKKTKDKLNSWCRDCYKIYDKERYPKEQIKRKLQARKYYKLNKEKCCKRFKKYRKDNPEKFKASQKKYHLSIKYVYCQLKYRGLKVDREKFIEWYNSQEKKCFYCGIPQSELIDRKEFRIWKNSERLSIDRKDCNQGYILKNMVLSCMRCNSIKSDFFSMKEMKRLANKFITPKWKNQK